MELKLIAKALRAFRASNREKPQFWCSETPMEEPAFRLLRQGLPSTLPWPGWYVYQGGAGRHGQKWLVPPSSVCLPPTSSSKP